MIVPGLVMSVCFRPGRFPSGCTIGSIPKFVWSDFTLCRVMSEVNVQKQCTMNVKKIQCLAVSLHAIEKFLQILLLHLKFHVTLLTIKTFRPQIVFTLPCLFTLSDCRDTSWSATIFSQQSYKCVKKFSSAEMDWTQEVCVQLIYLESRAFLEFV